MQLRRHPFVKLQIPQWQKKYIKLASSINILTCIQWSDPLSFHIEKIHTKRQVLTKKRLVQRRWSQAKKNPVTPLQREILGSRTCSHRQERWSLEKEMRVTSKAGLSSQFCLGPASSNAFLRKRETWKDRKNELQGNFNTLPKFIWHNNMSMEC